MSWDVAGPGSGFRIGPADHTNRPCTEPRLSKGYLRIVGKLRAYQRQRNRPRYSYLLASGGKGVKLLVQGLKIGIFWDRLL